MFVTCPADAAAARLHQRDDGPGLRLVWVGREVERGDAHQLEALRQRQAFGCGQAGAQAGERAGADGDADRGQITRP